MGSGNYDEQMYTATASTENCSGCLHLVTKLARETERAGLNINNEGVQGLKKGAKRSYFFLSRGCFSCLPGRVQGADGGKREPAAPRGCPPPALQEKHRRSIAELSLAGRFAQHAHSHLKTHGNKK